MKSTTTKNKLSEKSLNDLHQTIKAFFDNEGDDGDSIADRLIKELKANTYSISLWDAIGCDDLGLVKQNPELQQLYKTITEQWSKSQNKSKKNKLH